MSTPASGQNAAVRPTRVLRPPAVAAAPLGERSSNGLITARILLPDAQKGFYRGTRFDWSGGAHSLAYRGQEFYGPWFDKTSASVRDFAYDGEHIIAGPQHRDLRPRRGRVR